MSQPKPNAAHKGGQPKPNEALGGSKPPAAETSGGCQTPAAAADAAETPPESAAKTRGLDQGHEAALFGERFDNALALLDLFRNIDLDRITDLVRAVRRVTGAGDDAERVRGAVEVLKYIVALTPTERDDQIIAALESVVEEQLVDILARLVAGLRGRMDAQDVTIQARDRALVEAQGIPWGLLTRIALRVVDIIDRLAGH